MRDTRVLEDFLNDTLDRPQITLLTMEGDSALMRKAVLAENVEIRRDRESLDTVDVNFDFLCANCGKRHWGYEIDSLSSLFSTVGYQLKCGWVNIRMPWAETADRDEVNVYGKRAESEFSETSL
jgi:hypothetical protein